MRPRRPVYDENVDINTHNVLDTTTIFVGGLDVYGRCTWDEQRLKRIFGQYGEIVEVKLVRPGGWYAARAFDISHLILISSQKGSVRFCDVQG